MRFPKKIKPSPLREAVVEIRFDTRLPPDAVFGLMYSALRDSYSEFEPLPILQLPEIVRNKDPDFAYQPHHKSIRENFIVQTGPRVFALSMIPPLTEWSEFEPELLSVFDRIGKSGVVSGISRFGLRYINQFEGLILDRLNVSIEIMGREVETDQIYLRNNFAQGDFQVLLQIANSSEARRAGSGDNKKLESAIDTDVFKKGNGLDFFGNIRNMLSDAHQVQKEVFFGLISPKFLESLAPEY